MAYVRDWESLAGALKLVTAEGVGVGQAKVDLCCAIADQKIRVRVRIAETEELGAGAVCASSLRQVEIPPHQRLLNFVAHVEGEDWLSASWTQPGAVADLHSAFKGWNQQVERIIDAVDETFVWAVLDREPLTRWSFGRVTMLGDTCHPMLPFMGQGGAQAIEDAAALTACLLRCSDEIEALKLYEVVRLPRVSQIQGMSWENKTRFHMPDGPQQMERDAEMARGMTDWSYRAIAWLYGHDAGTLPSAARSAH